MARPRKPIRVFYSEMSGRLYATRDYREQTVNGRTRIVITGEKFDVTNDVAGIVLSNNLEFKPVSDDQNTQQ